MADMAADNIVVLNQQVSTSANGNTEVARFGSSELVGAESDNWGGDDLMLMINVTAGGTATGTLQWYIQDSWDNGNTWDDLISSNTFALGAATVVQRFVVQGKIATGITQGSGQSNLQLAAGTIRVGPFGSLFRVVEKLTAASGSPVGCTYNINCVMK